MTTASTPLTKVTEGLFELVNPADGAVQFYYLLTDAAQTKLGNANLTLQDSWNDYAGWYLFAPNDPTGGDSTNFVTQARNAMGTEPQTHGINSGAEKGIGWILWTTGLNDITTCPGVFWQLSGSNTVAYPDLDFTANRISISTNSIATGGPQIELYDGGDGSPPFFCVKGALNSAVNFKFDNDIQTATPPSQGWFFRFPVSGTACGSTAFPVGISASSVAQRFKCAFAYRMSSASSSGNATMEDTATTATDVILPIFPGMLKQTTTAFDVLVNPFQPLSPHATGIKPDTTGQLLLDTSDAPVKDANLEAMVTAAKALSSPYYTSPDGSILTMAPATTGTTGRQVWTLGGFGFSSITASGGDQGAAPAADPSVDTSYLSPAGLFTISAADDTAGTSTENLMPGLFSKAYFNFDASNLINCTPNQPADASGNSSPGGTAAAAGVDSAPKLGSDFTTSYVAFSPASTAQTILTEGGAQKATETATDYYGQASASTFYQSGTTSSIAVNTASLVRQISSDLLDPFPLLPFKAGFLKDATGNPLNPSITASEIELLERTVVATTRESILTKNSSGPVVVNNGPTNQILAAANPQASAEPQVLVTPQGYQLTTADGGGFASLTLAVGREGADTGPGNNNTLTFSNATAGQPIESAFAQLLSEDNLFLVMNTLPGTLKLDNVIAVSDFNFRINLTGDASSTILVFKYNPQHSLKELALNSDLWNQTTEYTKNRQQILQTLTQLFDTAEAHKSTEGNPFSAFNTMASDPSWTGIIAFQVPVDGNGMPADFQMLLGGIKGGLNAHHLGIQTSKINSTASGSAIAQSSIFGLIDYEGDDTGEPTGTGLDPQYSVARLIALIASSALVDLQVAVNLQLPGILGRALTMTQGATKGTAPNTIQIQGVYQRHGDVGRVTFVTDKAFSFIPTLSAPDIIRVMEEFDVRNASLIPVTGSSSGSNVQTGNGSETLVKANFVLGGQIVFAGAPFTQAPELDLFSYGAKQSNGDIEGLQYSGLTVSVSFDLDAEGQMDPATKKVVLEESSLTPSASLTAVRPDSLLGSLPLQLSDFVVATKNTKIGSSAQAVDIAQLHPSTPPNGDNDETVSPPVTTAPAYGLSYQVSLGTLGSLSSAHTGITATLTLAWGPSATVPDNDAATVLVELPSLSAGYKGFDLQGILRTKFGDANLVSVKVPGAKPSDPERIVYALLFGNIQLSVFGYTFPPGLLVDFLLFAGNAANAQSGVKDLGNIGWLLSATNQTGGDQG